MNGRATREVSRDAVHERRAEQKVPIRYAGLRTPIRVGLQRWHGEHRPRRRFDLPPVMNDPASASLDDADLPVRMDVNGKPIIDTAADAGFGDEGCRRPDESDEGSH